MKTRSMADSENSPVNVPTGGEQSAPRRVDFADPPRSPSVEQYGIARADRMLAASLPREGRLPVAGPSGPSGSEGIRVPLASSGTRATSPARSVDSVRSTGSTAMRRRMAQWAAEERLAAIQQSRLEIEERLIKKRLELDIEALNEEEESPLEEGQEKEKLVHSWVQETTTQVHIEPQPERQLDTVAHRGEPSRSEQTPSSRRSGVSQLVEAMEQLSKNRPPPRQVYDLPLFTGAAHEWFAFKAAMKETTRLYSFSPIENMARLRNSLRGEAKEAVAALLFTCNDPKIIMQTLEQCFGRPEVTIDKSIEELRRIPKPGPSAAELNAFAIKVQNVVSVLKCIDNKGYLYNPMLARDVCEKLPPHLRSRWCDYASSIERNNEPEIVIMSRFLMKEADQELRHAYSSKNSMPKQIQVNTARFQGSTALRRSNDATKPRRVFDNTQNRARSELPTQVFATNAYKCVLCDKEHTLELCPKYKVLSVADKYELLKKEKLCFKCIKGKHVRQFCKAKGCDVADCKRSHHPSLHEHKVAETEIVTSTVSSTDEVKLKVCPVTITGPKGSKKIFALLDEGSTVSLLDETIATQIGADGPSRQLAMRGVNMANSAPSKDIKFNIKGQSNEVFSMTARTIQNLELASQSISKTCLKLKHLNKINKKGLVYSNARPKLLIGSDHWELIVSRDLRVGKRREPAASRTQLGWVIHGTMPRKTLKMGQNQVLHLVEDQKLEQLVRENFTLDSLGIKTASQISKSEKRAIEIFEATAQRVNGRFEVGLPWKEDEPILPNSFNNAKTRLQNLERKLDKNTNLKNEYNKQIENLLCKGYAEKCDEQVINDKRWYLPHFPVTNPNKPGKVRLVFDAAATSKGVCLNDFLLEGPDMLQSLPRILSRFREYPVAVTADIQEMFLQIKIRQEDQAAQLFLWRGNDRNREPETYKMTSMIFGASSSPFLAHSVRNKNTEQFQRQYPVACRAITEAHYMDDYVDSYPDINEATKVIQDVDRIHKACGFHLRGWNSNCRDILTGISGELKTSSTGPLMTSEEKTLGLIWNSEEDTLSFNTNLNRVKDDVKNSIRIPTKREMLSAVMSVFDPLGLLSSYTISGKILLQRLWRQQVSWDEPVPEDIAQPFFVWMKEMANIGKLRLPRCYDIKQEATQRELHIFCDASEEAYAAAAYWRLEQPDGTGKTILISAKSKVAPLKTQTIPKMELQAATIGTRLADAVKRDHRVQITNTIYWTDSSTVFQWIQNSEKKYPTYVANRVSEIVERTSPSQWRWIPTKENPADAATRLGYVPTQDSNWFQGPEFLRLPREEWPVFGTRKQEHQEEKVYAIKEESPLIDISRFSSYEKLIRTTAMLFLYKDKVRDRSIVLGVKHLRKAEDWWVRKSQEDSFKEEITKLKKNSFIEKGSSIFKLDPILEDGIMKVNGRIQAAPVPESMKNPVILDGRHPFTRLLVQHKHVEAGHANNERVVNDLRQVYWIVNLRPTVKTVARNCKTCQIRRAKPKVPMMGNLPVARIEPFKRPFSNTGLDYFGPLTVAIGRRREKRWVALFTCLTTRAIHLEVVSTLSTGSAVMALRRMAARRGWPHTIWSDNASCFRGADVELRAAYEEWLPALQDVGLQHRVTWRFIPPGAPNQGGAWERLVRSVKTALKSTLNEKTPKEEIFTTLIVEAEHTINARPLTHVSVDPSDPEALTPNHFLLGSSSGLPTTGPCEEADRRTWRASQALADSFWQRWVREYLPTLAPRRESAAEHENIKVGDLVIVVDSSLPRNTWPRGIVERVYEGPDGQVRSADIRTRGGVFKRPSRKLAVLPVAGCDGVYAGGENVTDASYDEPTKTKENCN